MEIRPYVTNAQGLFILRICLSAVAPLPPHTHVWLHSWTSSKYPAPANISATSGCNILTSENRLLLHFCRKANTVGKEFMFDEYLYFQGLICFHLFSMSNIKPKLNYWPILGILVRCTRVHVTFVTCTRVHVTFVTCRHMVEAERTFSLPSPYGSVYF